MSGPPSERRLVNTATGEVAHAANCGTADGVDVRQWSRHNSACQQWSIRPVS
ncbi:RICIN domain-containing protein [Nonomuraea helvata]|uniref:RICIN domain-containing protein n=1 Tax=Nonomuraea helvata TaxID=37484 RepID=A0ABV5SAN8_9ACTN